MAKLRLTRDSLDSFLKDPEQIDQFERLFSLASDLSFGLTAGSAVASAASITPTGSVFHVTGVAAIANIALPYGGFIGRITLIPDGLFTLTAAGNIARVYTAVVNVPITLTYDGSKWYPSP
jgi:hypothetical protein